MSTIESPQSIDLKIKNEHPADDTVSAGNQSTDEQQSVSMVLDAGANSSINAPTVVDTCATNDQSINAPTVVDTGAANDQSINEPSVMEMFAAVYPCVQPAERWPNAVMASPQAVDRMKRQDHALSNTAGQATAVPQQPNPAYISQLYEYASKRKLNQPVFDFTPVRVGPTVNFFRCEVRLAAYPHVGFCEGRKVKAEAKALAAQDLLEKLRQDASSSGEGYAVTDQSDEQSSSLTASVGTTAPAGVGAHVTNSPKKRKNDDPGVVLVFPVADERNPIPTVETILRRVGWPQPGIEEDTTVQPAAQGAFQFTYVAGPLGPDGHSIRKYVAHGSGKSRKAARALAASILYGMIRDCPEFQALWQNTQQGKKPKGSNRNPAKSPVHPAVNKAAVQLQDSLRRIRPTGPAYQIMKNKLGVILGEMRSCANDAAAFLGSPLPRPPSTQLAPKNLINVSTVLESVARKLSDMDMAVHFSVDPTEGKPVDWTRDVQIDGHAEAVGSLGVKHESEGKRVGKDENDSESVGDDGMSGEAVKKEAVPEGGMKECPAAAEDVPEGTGISSELPVVDVTVDVSWREDDSNFPRLMTLKGSGSSYSAAKDAAAAEFFLFFGLREDEFEFPALVDDDAF
ncbi:hypothetical protein BV898_08886 [Hypsibius exemplaris]|uniref:DRBM domain-containing protein n=1 Tax=Hypsibius exemplaris TaxID=2072580 RepID=A0A1W0WPF8_HYPEX|nr:hypothetical protein BV898_08886 [Hypsibius exemplaris]